MALFYKESQSAAKSVQCDLEWNIWSRCWWWWL